MAILFKSGERSVMFHENDKNNRRYRSNLSRGTPNPKHQICCFTCGTWIHSFYHFVAYINIPIPQTRRLSPTASKPMSQQPHVIKKSDVILSDTKPLLQATPLNSYCGICWINLFSLESGIIKCCIMLSEIEIICWVYRESHRTLEVVETLKCNLISSLLL